MDGERFDGLSRKLATPRSRREVLGVLGAAVAGLFTGRSASAAPRQDPQNKGKPVQDKPSRCYGSGSHCTNGKQCCSGICSNRQCEPEVAPGCASSAECPGVDSECQHRTCVEGQCGAAMAPYGTPVGHQIEGDCKAVVCDGAGAIITIEDPLDVPVGDCWTAVCTNGEPEFFEKPIGETCDEGGGQYCDGAGQCVECLFDEHCASGACRGSVCVAPCEADPSLGTPCAVGVGACQGWGTHVCGDDGQLVCDAVEGSPSVEICNGIDDDCDGLVDEDFDLQIDPLNCGECGKVCTSGQCVEGVCTEAT